MGTDNNHDKFQEELNNTSQNIQEELNRIMQMQQQVMDDVIVINTIQQAIIHLQELLEQIKQLQEIKKIEEEHQEALKQIQAKHEQNKKEIEEILKKWQQEDEKIKQDFQDLQNQIEQSNKNFEIWKNEFKNQNQKNQKNLQIQYKQQEQINQKFEENQEQNKNNKLQEIQENDQKLHKCLQILKILFPHDKDNFQKAESKFTKEQKQLLISISNNITFTKKANTLKETFDNCLAYSGSYIDHHNFYATKNEIQWFKTGDTFNLLIIEKAITTLTTQHNVEIQTLQKSSANNDEYKIVNEKIPYTMDTPPEIEQLQLIESQLQKSSSIFEKCEIF